MCRIPSEEMIIRERTPGESSLRAQTEPRAKDAHQYVELEIYADVLCQNEIKR